MKVYIFTESGSKIGLGHISRCIAICNELISRNIDVEVILFGEVTDSNISRTNITFADWINEDFDFITEEDIVLIDSYLAGEEIYKKISRKCLKSIYIDDNNRINYPKGLILNPSMSDVEIYKDSLNQHNNIKIGPDYVILRKPFRDSFDKRINKEVRDVLLMLGSSDIRNLMPTIIRVLLKFDSKINYHIVSSKITEEQINISMRYSEVKLYNNLEPMAVKNLMMKVDFAVTAMGQTIYELISCKTPFIGVKTIDNQSNNIQGILKHNQNQIIINHNVMNFEEELFNALKRIRKYSFREGQSKLFSSIMDSKGIERIVNEIFIGG